MDHDQRFKTLIREFFAAFLRLFFARWTSNLNLTTVHWLNTELFPDPPEGVRHAIDLVAQVAVAATTPDTESDAESTTESGKATTLLLVHIEIEAPDRATRLKPRLPYYYHFLRDQYLLPVLPLVLYLKVGLDGIGFDSVVETVQGFEVNRFQYLYAGLSTLDGLEYVQGDNLLGVALSALMRIPKDRVVWLGAEALRRLATASLTEQQRFLLGECVQAYLPLDAAQKQELEQLLQTETYVEVRAMNKTIFEEGIEKGIEKGRREERLELVWELLNERFGPVAGNLRPHLERLTMEELRRLTKRITTVSTLVELGLPATAT